jgi:hypothetical protein
MLIGFVLFFLPHDCKVVDAPPGFTSEFHAGRKTKEVEDIQGEGTGLSLLGAGRQ